MFNLIMLSTDNRAKGKGLKEVKVLKVLARFTARAEAHYKPSPLLLRTLIIKLCFGKHEEVQSWVQPTISCCLLKLLQEP